MSLLTLLMIVGPPVAMIALGVVLFNLAKSGYLHEHTYVGWAVLGVELAIFFWAAVRQAGAPGSGFTALAYIFFLGLIFATQAFHISELFVLTFAPDRSDGLKVIKTYSIVERKIIEDDLRGSIAEYEGAVADDPGDIEARLRLAEMLFRNEDYEKCGETYEDVLKRERRLSAERHCLILTRLAKIHAEQFSDPDKARELLLSIIDKYPDTRFSKYARECMAGL